MSIDEAPDSARILILQHDWFASRQQIVAEQVDLFCDALKERSPAHRRSPSKLLKRLLGGLERQVDLRFRSFLKLCQISAPGQVSGCGDDGFARNQVFAVQFHGSLQFRFTSSSKRLPLFVRKHVACDPIILAATKGDQAPHMSSRVHSNRVDPQPNHWFVLAAILSFIKLVIFVLDSSPQVYLGDSMSYLTTAMLGWIPADRSFVYGYIVYGLTARSRSLSSLVAVQTVAGIATSLVTAAILVRYFRTSFAIAAAAAIAITLEPQQLLFERFVMTESLSTAVFALFLWFALEYLRSRKVWALAALQVAGLVLVAFRVSFVPLLATVTIVAPLLAGEAWRGLPRQWKRLLPQLGVHVLISAGLFAGLHAAYKSWNGALSHLPPAYTYADGFFLLTNVSPLVTAADTDNPDVAVVLAAPLAYAIEPQKMHSRNSEMFDDHGLIPRLQKALKDDYKANVESKRVAWRVIRRDPVGVMRLAIQTHLKFYSKPYMGEVLKEEAGVRGLSADDLKLLTHYHLDAEDLPFKRNITREYYFAIWPYCVLLINAPLILLGALLFSGKDTRTSLCLLFAIIAVHSTVLQALTVEPSVRHHHATAVPLALGLSVIASRFVGKRSDPRKK